MYINSIKHCQNLCGIENSNMNEQIWIKINNKLYNKFYYIIKFKEIIKLKIFRNIIDYLYSSIIINKRE